MVREGLVLYKEVAVTEVDRVVAIYTKKGSPLKTLALTGVDSTNKLDNNRKDNVIEIKKMSSF